jgi:hypothetical protein
MAGKNYTWQVSSPNIETGEGVISSTYKINGKIPITTISTSNPLGYVKVFPNSNSNNLNIKNLEYAIRTDGKITYRVQDGTQNPRLYNSLQDLADGRGNWDGTTTMQVQKQMTANLTASIKSYNQNNPAQKIGPSTAPSEEPTENEKQVASVEESLEGAQSINITNITGNVKTDYGSPLYYPSDLRNNRQDRIIFTMKRLKGSVINPNTFNSNVRAVDRRVNIEDIKGSVTLPIQPLINDNNTVDWSGGTLNAIQAYGAAASMKLIGSENGVDLANNASRIMGAIAKEITSKGIYQDAFKVYFAQEAVGVQNLLSRATGAVLNPNLELLFNGPSLRPFGFTFRLSPRDNKEATEIRKIIRFFKQGMSVKTTSSNVFLQSPNVFDIHYKTYDKDGKEIEHPSINRIKRCALLSCDVDYTPDGTYMTYNDERRTMTSYGLTLRFNELDPLYEDDYNTNSNNNETSSIQNDEIGY